MAEADPYWCSVSPQSLAPPPLSLFPSPLFYCFWSVEGLRFSVGLGPCDLWSVLQLLNESPSSTNIFFSSWKLSSFFSLLFLLVFCLLWDVFLSGSQITMEKLPKQCCWVTASHLGCNGCCRVGQAFPQGGQLAVSRVIRAIKFVKKAEARPERESLGDSKTKPFGGEIPYVSFFFTL